MNRIITDDELHTKLKNASIKRAKDFSWSNAAKETVEVYKKFS